MANLNYGGGWQDPLDKNLKKIISLMYKFFHNFADIKNNSSKFRVTKICSRIKNADHGH